MPERSSLALPLLDRLVTCAALTAATCIRNLLRLGDCVPLLHPPHRQFNLHVAARSGGGCDRPPTSSGPCSASVRLKPVHVVDVPAIHHLDREDPRPPRRPRHDAL